MTLTSTSSLGVGERKEDVAEKPKVTIIKTTRAVCVRSNPETGDVTDADAGEVHRVPAQVANILIGDGSAVAATEDDLAAFEKSKTKAAKTPEK